MKILHSTDLHDTRPWFDWIASQAADFDACCVSGDLLNTLGVTDSTPCGQIEAVQSWACTFTGRLFLCSGNHDSWIGRGSAADALNEGRWMHSLRRHPTVYADGDVANLHGFNFACLPYHLAHGLRIPSGDLPVFLLAHAPPPGTPVSITKAHGEDLGRVETAIIARKLPFGSVILSGHVHSPRHWCAEHNGVLCLNPGISAGPVPNHIVIDTEKQTFTHWMNGRPCDHITWPG